MSQLPQITLTTRRAIVTPLNILAIGCTIFRLGHRFQKRQLWWDDYWAGISMVVMLAYMLSPWLKTESGPPPPKSKQIFLYWFQAELYPFVVWAARISIGMSIARFTPAKTRGRYLLYVMNGIFAAMCITQVLHKIVVCTRNTSWHNNPAVQCYLGISIGILSLCMDVAADTCLVTIPLRMLWRVKLPPSERRMIMSIFASSLASSMAGIVYLVFVFEAQKYRGNRAWGYSIGLVSAIKAAVTLLVCNLLVIVTFLYRKFRRDDDESASESESSIEMRTKPSPPADTILTPIMPADTFVPTSTFLPTTTLILTEISTPAPSTTTDSFPTDFSDSKSSVSSQTTTPIKQSSQCHAV